jgi:hypothetical protein
VDDHSPFPRPFQAIERKRATKPTFLEDSRFRSALVSLASTCSRRGAARIAGISQSTLLHWLDRGEAEPHIEPYGSFARDYLRAERGLERGSGSAIALRCAAILEAEQRAADYWANRSPDPPPKPERPPKGADPEELDAYERECELWKLALAAWQHEPKTPSTADYDWLLRVQVSRFPQEHGATAYRELEKEPDGTGYLERRGMTHEQIVVMLTDPPEPVFNAIAASCDALYRVMLSTGWLPPHMINDERQSSDQRSDSERAGEGPGSGGGAGEAEAGPLHDEA